MPQSADIDALAVVLAMKKKIWVRVEGAHLQYGSPIEVRGYDSNGNLTGEVWSGVFLDGSLSPNGNNGKKGMLLAWEIATYTAEQKQETVVGSESRIDSSHIDVTITNPGANPTTSQPPTEIPPDAMPST